MKVSELIDRLKPYSDYEVVIDGIIFDRAGWEGGEIEDPDIEIYHDAKKICIEGTQR